jgi:hypothetical protein
MKKQGRIRSRVGVLAVVATAALAAPAAAQGAITEVFTDTATPVDCTVQAAPNAGVRFCSQQSGETRSTVPTFDGVPIDVNVAFPPEPASGPDGPYPVVMMFHGYAGSKLGLSSMKRWLDQGYATFSMTTRGFGESCGSPSSRAAAGAACDDGYVRLMDTRYEVRDAQELIALLVDEGLVDPGAIAATGGSYGGGLSMSLAALKNRKMLPDGTLTAWQSPDGIPLEIAAAAPQIPWSDLAYSLVPNGGLLDYVADAPYFGHIDRIGIEKKSWVNQLYLGGLFFGYYSDPGTDPSADLTTWKAILDTGGPYGPEVRDIVEEITTYHSSYYIDDSVEPAPVLISSGFTDDLFPASEAGRYYNRTLTTYPDADIALTYADFGHPRGQNQSQTTQFIGGRENAWFAHYVKGQGSEPVQGVDALTQACGAPPAGPFHSDNLGTLAPGEITFDEAAAKTIGTSGVLFGPDFQSVAGGPPAPNSCKTVGPGDSSGGAIYKLPAAPAGGYTLLGSPTVIATFDSPGENNQIAARLMDIAPNGDQKLIARGLWRPEVGTETQVFQLFPNAWKFEEGHVAKLELLPFDDPYSNVATGQTEIEVTDLELRLPVAESPGALSGLVAAPAEKILPGATQLAPGFDSGPPVTRFVLTPRRVSRDSSPTFDYMSSDVGSTYECRLDSTEEADFEPCPRNLTLTGVGDGDHVFEVRAMDGDNLMDPTPIVFEFTVDTVAPETSVELEPGPGEDLRAVFSSNEEGAKFECRRTRDDDWKRCNSPRTVNPNAKPPFLKVRAVDQAGNKDRSPAVVRPPEG